MSGRMKGEALRAMGYGLWAMGYGLWATRRSLICVAHLFEQFTSRDIQSFSQVDKTLIENPAFPVFDVDQQVSGDPGPQRKLLLGHAPPEPRRPDIAADSASPVLPSSDPLWIVLAGAGWHADQ